MNEEKDQVTEENEVTENIENQESVEEVVVEASVEEQLNQLNDKYLRLFSEFDNFRKRTIKEKSELSKTASESLMKVLLPVLDDFERASKAHEESGDAKSLKEGIDLIQQKLFNTLQQKGLESMDSMHKEFNPDLHEALTNIPAPKDKLKGKVLDVLEKGYQLNGKIIRYAKVVVGN